MSPTSPSDEMRKTMTLMISMRPKRFWKERMRAPARMKSESGKRKYPTPKSIARMS
jgi:hypothetical protein